MIRLAITVALILLMVFVLKKKLYAQTTLMLFAVLILMGYSIITKTSILGQASKGHMFLDVFEYLTNTFFTVFRGTGILIVTIVGYSGYMKKIKATDMLAALLVKPLRKIKSPYVVCALTMIIGEYIHVALPSGSGSVAIIMAAFLPVLLSIGVPRLTAAATVMASIAMDFGPASGSWVIIVPMMGENVTMMDSFRIQLLIYPIAIVIFAIVSVLTYRYMDKKENAQPELESMKEVEIKDIGVPIYYAFFPILPIVLVIVFSDLVLKSMTISVPSAVFICLLFVVIIDSIRIKDYVKAFSDTKELFFEGGKFFGSNVTLITVATVFGGAVRVIGGFDVFSSIIANLGLPPVFSFLILGFLAQIVVFATTSNAASLATLGPSALSISNEFGINPLMGVMPLVTASSAARALCPINGINLAAAGLANVNIMDLIKRNFVPHVLLVPIVSILCHFILHY
jgi:DcuC family C4-dicarboxylate transporter